jgi:hypothetical protein
MMRQELAGIDALNLSPAQRDKARLAVIDKYLARVREASAVTTNESSC